MDSLKDRVGELEDYIENQQQPEPEPGISEVKTSLEDHIKQMDRYVANWPEIKRVLEGKRGPIVESTRK